MTLKELIAKSWKKAEWEEIILGEILFAPVFIQKSVDIKYQSNRYQFLDALRANFPFLQSLSDKEIQKTIGQLYGNDWKRNRKNVQNWMKDRNVPQEDALIDLLSALYKKQTEFYKAQKKDREFPDKVKYVKTVIGNMLDYAGRESDEFNKVYMRDLDNVAYMFTVLHGENKKYYDTLKTDLKTALKQKQNAELEARLTQLKALGTAFSQEININVQNANAPRRIRKAIHKELPEIHAGRQGWIDLDVAWLNPADLSNNTIFEAISTDAQEALKGDSELTCNEILAQCIFNQMYNATNEQVNKLCNDLKRLCDKLMRNNINNIEHIVKNSYNKVYGKAVLKAIIGSLQSVTENKTVTAMVESEIECDGVLQNRDALIKFIQGTDPDWFMAKGHRSKIKACIQAINEINCLYDKETEQILSLSGQTRQLMDRIINITNNTFEHEAFEVAQNSEEAAEKAAEAAQKAAEAAQKAAEDAQKAAEDAQKVAEGDKKAVEIAQKAAEAAEKAAEAAQEEKNMSLYYNLCKQCIKFDKNTIDENDDEYLAKFKELSFRTMLLFFVAENELQQNLDVENFNAATIRTGIDTQLKAVGFVPLGARRASAADQYVEMVIGYAEELVNGG